MRKALVLTGIGLIAGGLDLIPLLLAEAPLFNMVSVVVFWLVTVFFIERATVLQRHLLNGLVVSVLMMLPLALAVAATNPRDFLPMMLMAFVLGPFCGYAIGRLLKRE